MFMMAILCVANVWIEKFTAPLADISLNIFADADYAIKTMVMRSVSGGAIMCVGSLGLGNVPPFQISEAEYSPSCERLAVFKVDLAFHVPRKENAALSSIRGQSG